MSSCSHSGWFITGTDTGVGKTLIATALMSYLTDRGLHVVGYKPVAAGATATARGLRNQDALALRSMSSVPVAYEAINPVCLAPPVAPHLAAQEAGVEIDIERLTRACDRLACVADFVVAEGAGGWLVPLNSTTSMADLAQALGYPVILVVGLRLGCLNHALLTTAAIAASGLSLCGWVGNQLACEPMHRLEDNLATLRQRIAAPCLGVVPYLREPQGGLAKTCLDLSVCLTF